MSKNYYSNYQNYLTEDDIRLPANANSGGAGSGNINQNTTPIRDKFVYHYDLIEDALACQFIVNDEILFKDITTEEVSIKCSGNNFTTNFSGAINRRYKVRLISGVNQVSIKIPQGIKFNGVLLNSDKNFILPKNSTVTIDFTVANDDYSSIYAESDYAFIENDSGSMLFMYSQTPLAPLVNAVTIINKVDEPVVYDAVSDGSIIYNNNALGYVIEKTDTYIKVNTILIPASGPGSGVVQVYLESDLSNLVPDPNVLYVVTSNKSLFTYISGSFFKIGGGGGTSNFKIVNVQTVPPIGELETLYFEVSTNWFKWWNGSSSVYDGVYIPDLTPQELTNLINNITTLQTDVTNITSDITQINTDITNIQGDVTNITSDITQINTDITTLQTDVTNINTDITNIETDLTTEINNRIQGDNNLQSLINGLASLGRYIDTYDNYSTPAATGNTTIPTNLSQLPTTVAPYITINDYIIVRDDETHNNKITRYVLQSINTTTGDLTWSFNITMSGSTSGFMPLVSNAVQGEVAVVQTTGEVDGYTLTGSNGITITTNNTAGTINFSKNETRTTGGTTGQVLTKKSSTNFDTEWKDVPKEVPDNAATDTDKVLTAGATANSREWKTVAVVKEVPDNDVADASKVLTAGTTANSRVWQDIPKEVPDNAPTDANKVLTAGLTPNSREWKTLAPLPNGGTANQFLSKIDVVDGNVHWVTIYTVPTGGATDQVLAKSSATDGALKWLTLPKELPAGGAASQVLAKSSATDYAVSWQTINQMIPGGLTGQILTKSADTDYALAWTDSSIPNGGNEDDILTKNSGTDRDFTWKSPVVLIPGPGVDISESSNGDVIVSINQAYGLVLSSKLTDSTPADSQLYALKNHVWTQISGTFIENLDDPINENIISAAIVSDEQTAQTLSASNTNCLVFYR